MPSPPKAVASKAVVWDFGNVIVRWSPRTLYQKIFPDPAECFGHAPGELLFVDDSARSIEAAQAPGFDVRHLTDPAALRPALEARGLL